MELALEDFKRKTRQASVDIEFHQEELQRNFELLRLQTEAKSRHEQELAARESETQIRLAEISSASNTNLSTTQNNSNLSCRQIRDLPPLRSLDREQIESYLSNFEKLCKLNEIPENKYCAYIASKLPSELVQILTKVPTEDSQNYTLFLENVSRKYLLNSDYFRSKFYSLNIESGDSNAEFICKLCETFDRWLQLEQVTKDYQNLYDFVIKQ